MNRVLKFASLTLITAVMLSSNALTAKADLGPVHVELNTTGDRPGGVRANTVTAYKIHIRINKEIKPAEWIKIWFPIDEASCDPKDVCNGMPKITGDKENPRFVPNEKYFAKYPDSKEKDFGKLYQVLEDRNGNTRFEECECNAEDNCCAQGKCRVVPDPSGLGCWIMGAVLPQLPRDDKERYHRLVQIIYSTAIAFTGDGESQGLPFIINTCKERSYRMNSPLEVDAWRKGYNPIDFNTSKATGILAPATPGRYTLMVATQPEPTPVESEAFVLPCSQISAPNVEFKKMNTDYATPFKVRFTTGEGGALDKDNSGISIKFPEQFQIPNADVVKQSSVFVNGQKVAKKPLFDRDNRKLVVTCPVDIDAFSDVEVEIGKEAGIRTPKTKGNYRLEVCTDSEPEFVSSEEFQVDLVPSAFVTPNTEFFDASYSLLGAAPRGGIEKASEISINFPEGTYMPPEIDPGRITINNVPCSIKPIIDGTKLLVKTPVAIEKYIDIEIVKCGIKNPSKGGYSINYSYKNETFEFGGFEIKPSNPYIGRIDFTNYTNCEQTGIRILYYPSTSSPIKTGDKITVEFPDDFKLPKNGSIQEIKLNQKTPLSMETSNNFLHIISGVDADFRDGVEIVIGENFGIINSNYFEICRITLIHNGIEIVSNDILFFPPQPKTEIEVKWPEGTKSAELGGYVWHNKPPKINFSWCFLKQYVYYSPTGYYPNFLYEKEIQLFEGLYVCNFSYQGFIGEKSEPLKTEKFCIDTQKTSLSFEGNQDHFYTNEMSFMVYLKRNVSEIEDRNYYEVEQKEEYIYDGIKINGEIILNPEINGYPKGYDVKLNVEKSVALKEGDNIIEIASFDQFGDSDTKKITVTRDTKPPQMSIITPQQNALYISGTTVEISVETEPDAEIDLGRENNIEEILENASSKIYKAKLPVKIGKNEINISVHDRAGNITTKKLVFFGVLPMISEFWLGNTSWTLNGKEQAQMKSPPTSSAPPLPKDLAGATYMPVAEMGIALSSRISWDAKTKKVTISQSLPNGKTAAIEAWVGNKKAKINGKEVWIDDKHRLYPAIVNGKTMLPLRFIAENLNSDVFFDAAAKSIKVIFPSEKIIGKLERK